MSVIVWVTKWKDRTIYHHRCAQISADLACKNYGRYDFLVLSRMWRLGDPELDLVFGRCFRERQREGRKIHGRGKHTITLPRKRFWAPPLIIRFPLNLYRVNGREGWGRKLLLTPPGNPQKTPTKNANPGVSLSLSLFLFSAGMLFRGFLKIAGRGQQQFATQTLRVHLLGID